MAEYLNYRIRFNGSSVVWRTENLQLKRFWDTSLRGITLPADASVADFSIDFRNGPVEHPCAMLCKQVLEPFLSRRQVPHLFLHASAVEWRGRAILFCGPAKSGKSTYTLAALLLGAKLISEDLCVLTHNPPRVQPLFQGRIHLWSTALEFLRRFSRDQGLAEFDRMGQLFHRPKDPEREYRFLADHNYLSKDPLPLERVFVLAPPDSTLRNALFAQTKRARLALEAALEDWLAVLQLGDKLTHWPLMDLSSPAGRLDAATRITTGLPG